MSPARRRKPAATLEQALESDYPIGEIMELIDIEREPGRTFNWAHAFMLEVYSATMSILFDRFEDDELDEMETALTTIGATRTLADWRIVRATFNDLLAKGEDRFDASETVDGSPELKPLLKRFADHNDEVQAKLLEFAKANWSQLARSG